MPTDIHTRLDQMEGWDDDPRVNRGLMEVMQRGKMRGAHHYRRILERLRASRDVRVVPWLEALVAQPTARQTQSLEAIAVLAPAVLQRLAREEPLCSRAGRKTGCHG